MMKMKKVIITLTICFILFPHFVFADGDPEIMPWLRVLGKAWINGDLVVNGSITGGTMSYATGSFQSIVTPSGDLTITPVGDDVLLDGGLTVGSSTQAGDNNLRVEGNAAIVGSVTTSDLYLQDTDASHTLNVHWNENEASANRTLNLAVVGGTRTLTMNQSLTVGSGNDGTLTYSAASKTLTVEDNVTIGLDVNALEGLSSTGVVTRTAANTYSERTITGTASEVEVTNGDGVSGNPTIGLPDDVSIESDLTINPTVADQEDPTFTIKADADLDGGETTTGSFSMSITPDATPANATLDFGLTSLQGITMPSLSWIGVDANSCLKFKTSEMQIISDATTYKFSASSIYAAGNRDLGANTVQWGNLYFINNLVNAPSGNSGYHELSLYNASPEILITDTDINKQVDSEAEAEDSSAVHITINGSNNGQIAFKSAEGDAADISVDTDDKMQFANASGGYVFDDDLTINGTVADTENPVVHYYYDADSDGGATSNGHLSISGTAVANPANSYITVDANDVGLGLKVEGGVGVNVNPSGSFDLILNTMKANTYISTSPYTISATSGFYNTNAYRGSITSGTQSAGGAIPWNFKSGGLAPSVATGGYHTFYVDDTTAAKIDSTRHIVLYSESNPGTLSNAEWYLTQGDQMNFASASGGYNFDGTINTMNMSNGVTGEVTNWNTVKIYNDSTIAAETTLTDVLPAGYAIDKIIFKNTTANTITNLDIGFTDGGEEIVGASNISASDEGSFTINQQIDDFDAVDTIYISASNWNSANLIIYIRMVRMF